MTTKTGGWNSTWVELERPKPAPVSDHYEFGFDKPPTPSPRCGYWLRQIERGWRPPLRISRMGREAAGWYGVHLWEYLNVIYPALTEAEGEVLSPAPGVLPI